MESDKNLPAKKMELPKRVPKNMTRAKAKRYLSVEEAREIIAKKLSKRGRPSAEEGVKRELAKIILGVKKEKKETKTQRPRKLTKAPNEYTDEEITKTTIYKYLRRGGPLRLLKTEHILEASKLLMKHLWAVQQDRAEQAKSLPVAKKTRRRKVKGITKLQDEVED